MSRAEALLALTLFAGARGWAQTRRPRTFLVAIGASRAEVRAGIGKPEAVYAPDTDQYYPLSAEDSLMSLGFGVEDVFERSGLDAFRLTVSYEPDGSKSRLDPTDRVVSVRFMPDKEEPFREMLEHIPEAVALCREGGCLAQGEVTGGVADVVLCRWPSSPAEARTMDGAAAGWGPDKASGWLPCAAVYFEGEYGAFSANPGLPDWGRAPVDYIEIGPRMLPSESGIADSVVPLGKWLPGAR